LSEFFKAILIVCFFVAAQISYILVRAVLRKKQDRNEKKRVLTSQKAAIKHKLAIRLAELFHKLMNDDIFWIEIYGRSMPEARLVIQKNQDKNTQGLVITGIRNNSMLRTVSKSIIKDSESTVFVSIDEPEKFATEFVSYLEEYYPGYFPENIELRCGPEPESDD